MAFLLLTFCALIAYLSWHLLCLYTNYQQARRIGLPIIITPINVMNPIWILTQSWLGPLLSTLPFGLGGFVDYSTLSWPFAAKHAIHDRLGDAFTIVNPGENHVVVADADAVEEILTRRKDFQKSEAMYKALEVFGPNLDTVEGDTWQRHRRITTPPFNERNSSLVWRESLAQTRDMLQSWTSTTSSDGITSTDSNIRTLALHVLTAAGFGKSYSFADGGLTKPADGHTMTYKDALTTILRHILITVVVSSATFPTWMLPRKVWTVSEAIANFKAYMTEMVEGERAAMANGEENKDNLMSVLVRAAELSKADEKGRNSLTDKEIFGNLFIYNLAGHESSANTLAYAVTLLSTNRAVQDWIGEEVDAVFETRDDVETWEYEQAFPQLKRCMALMYETLRLYGPVIFIPKYTNEASRTLVINEKEYTIPSKTYVNINVAAIHSTPKYWGTDSMVWRPNRWIITPPSSSSTTTAPQASTDGLPTKSPSSDESFLQPLPGSYVPWAHGPRICPGKKFSQVEFTAVVACLLRHHRVEPVRHDGESLAGAAARVLKAVEDSELEVTLKIRHPEEIKLKWTEREKRA